ncbi:hypothetical protein ES708_25953 [subsurface metagenome]
MNYWIINHTYDAFQEHNNLIGLPSKKNKDTGEPERNSEDNLIPKYSLTNKIQTGDKIVYYCPNPLMEVIGLFKIEKGRDQYANDWGESIQFKIKPIKVFENKRRIPYRDLVDNLKIFRGEDGNILNPKACAARLIGTIKQIDEEDFDKIKNLYSKSESSIKPDITTKPHINMIRISHLLSVITECYSFIGNQERNRVINTISGEEEDDFGIKNQTSLPGWIIEIGNEKGTVSRLKQIDNIWFEEEHGRFFIPFAAFEHERSNDLPGVMNRFSALNETLQANSRFKDVDPLYFIIAEDINQVEKYKNSIKRNGKWTEFQESHNLHILPIEWLEKKENKFLKILTGHIRELKRK